MMLSWLTNGRSYMQWDHCGHHGILSLSWNAIFVEQDQGASKLGHRRALSLAPLFLVCEVSQASCTQISNHIHHPHDDPARWSGTKQWEKELLTASIISISFTKRSLIADHYSLLHQRAGLFCLSYLLTYSTWPAVLVLVARPVRWMISLRHPKERNYTM